jgi:hypothetical protein
MIIFEIHVPSKFFPQLLRRDILADILIEFELLASKWINEGSNKLEESPDNPWNYTYLSVRLSKTLQGLLQL